MDADVRSKENNISKTVRALLYLVTCALKERIPDPAQLSGVDLEKVYRLAKYHSLTSIACMALEETDLFAYADPVLAERWKKEKDQAVRKTMLLNAEREQIQSDLEKAGIWYLPLKGNRIQELYPGFGMRQSADVDILYDSSRQADVYAIMTGRGYLADNVGKSHHDIYKKPPVYNIEMHTALFEEVTGDLYKYYKDVKDRLLPMDGVKFGYCFREEDFYVYVTAHAFIHYKVGGTGLRTLADNYAYLRARSGQLDWKYMRGVFERIGMVEFEETIRSLSEKIFGSELLSPESFTEDERALLADCVAAGTYGTIQGSVRKRMEELGISAGNPTMGNKLRYVWKRLRRDDEWLSERAPVVARHKLLLPFYMLYRAFRQMILRPRSLGKELRGLASLKKKG